MTSSPDSTTLPSSTRAPPAPVLPPSNLPPASRHNLRSTEEPNAFRIARAPPPNLDPALLPIPSIPTSASASASADTHADPALTTPSPDAVPGLSPFINRTPIADLSSTAQPASDPASWLPSTDLLSPTFNAHHFLQRVLSHTFDKSSRPARLPALDDAFDADAALAALDTVESALRRRRDAARRDELSARDALRNALHLSAKRRDNLMRTAHNVTTHVATFGTVGQTAATALSTDLAAMKSASGRLAALHDARDLLSLLTRDPSELDAVRVSKLLASVNALLRSGQLSRVLNELDVSRARREILRCERELEASIFDWMKRAADDGNPHIVSECAMAAEELGVSHRFVEAYVQHVFSFDAPAPVTIRGLDGGTASVVLEAFRNACWEAVSVVRDSLSTVFESFSDPSRPLATLLQMVAQKKVLVVANAILVSLVESIRHTEKTLDELKSTSNDVTQIPDLTQEGRRRSSVERMRSLAIADSKESWRENAQRATDERRRYLIVCADMFTSLSKLKRELFELCRVPGSSDVEKMFAMLSDPYKTFFDRYLSQFLDIQKTWIDDRLGVAFFDITRIDVHAPRLAPRERSDADVYHRYRSFYGYVSANFLQMTHKAIQSTFESVCRTVAVMSSIPKGPVSSEAGAATSAGDRKNSTSPSSQSQEGKYFREHALNDMGNGPKVDAEGVEKTTTRSVNSLSEMRVVVRELLDSLIMNYVANAETLLQAATHLLPVCEEDAEMAQLWMSGASPLTAYIQAIEVVTKSTQLLNSFVLSLTVEEGEVSDDGETVVPKELLERFIPQETREVLHGELTSGLVDLGSEVHVGVQAAVSSLRARLFAMLTSARATEVYSRVEGDGEEGGDGMHPRVVNVDNVSQSGGLDNEPSETFMSASTFVEQQLQAVVASMTGANREFVVTEMSRITREAVLHCWCCIVGCVSVVGALQMIADGKAMVQVFLDHGVPVEAMECLPVVGQLFLEGADGLWGCVESKALADVDAKVIVRLLRKRDDYDSERVVKVCQSLGEDVGALANRERR